MEPILRPRDRLPRWRITVVWIDNFHRHDVQSISAIDHNDAAEIVSKLPLDAKEGWTLLGVRVRNPLGQVVAERGKFK